MASIFKRGRDKGTAIRQIKRKDKIGNRTYNHYVQAIDSFSNWLVAMARHPEAGRYSPDMAKHWAFGTDSSLQDGNRHYAEKLRGESL